MRLHPYQSERVLSRFAVPEPAGRRRQRAPRAPGRPGYHRGATGAALPLPARVLVAADAYHAMTEPRAHRELLPAETAAKLLGDEAGADG